MEYLQWTTEKESLTHHTMLRIPENEVASIKNFDKVFEKASKDYNFDYTTDAKNNVIAKCSNKDLNICLNTSMKMFEIYLTVKNM
jgi:hypothetical protein